MDVRILSTICFLVTILPTALTYESMQAYIPNGDKVPHPCGNGIWAGVAHDQPSGKSGMNAFGNDFKAVGWSWTEELCWMDSDGDGRTNGEELGDPNCRFDRGDVPELSEGITHPGYCNREHPAFSGCNAANVLPCMEDERRPNDGEINCDYVDSPGVMNYDLRFQKTKIPATETNYYCQTFDIPADQDYHVIAFKPLIDNAEVVHHMVLYGCETNDTKRFDEPGVCGMNGDDSDKCQAMLAVWTLGLDRVCYAENTGFRVGKSGYQMVKLEIHWNNEFKKEGLYDASGLSLFFQFAQDSVQDLATFMIGQEMLEIPPGRSRHEEVGVCSSICTGYFFQEPVYVTAAFNHMHLLGYSMKVEIFREGNLYKTLTHDEDYDYNAPKFYRFEPQVKLLPGDELKTTCVYDSTGKDRYVHFGEATSDEMCYAFLVAYPTSAIRSLPMHCTSRGPLDTCMLYGGMPYDNCNWAEYVNISYPASMERYMALRKNCNLNGQCRPECKPVVKQLMSHPCMNREMAGVVTWLLGMYKEGMEYLARLNSCPVDDDEPVCDEKQCAKYCDWDDDWTDGGPYSGAETRDSTKFFALLIMALAMCLRAVFE